MIENRFFHNKAFVLANYDSGEADRSLVLLTEDFGKITTVIKGIRKSKKRERVATELLSYVDFTFYKKGEQFIVSNFSTIEIFTNIREDLERLCFGFYLLELVNKFVFEGYRVPKVFQLLKNSLYYLEKESFFKNQLLLILYVLRKMIQEEGVLEEKEIYEKLSVEEGQILHLLEKNQIKELQQSVIYTEGQILGLIKKMENYVNDKLDTKMNIEYYMMGGLLC